MPLSGHTVGYTKSKVRSRTHSGGKTMGMTPDANRGGKPPLMSGTWYAKDPTC
jgi:hypothetical protein